MDKQFTDKEREERVEQILLEVYNLRIIQPLNASSFAT